MVKELKDVKERVDGKNDALTQFVKDDYFADPSKSDPQSIPGLHPDLPR